SSSSPACACLLPLSLHDALPIYREVVVVTRGGREGLPRDRIGGRGRAERVRPEGRIERLAAEDAAARDRVPLGGADPHVAVAHRSEEHTSELQSREKLVCRLRLA